MKLSKTAAALLQQAQDSRVKRVCVCYGFQYRREFGVRALNAARELVAAGLLECVHTESFREVSRGHTKAHGFNATYRLIENSACNVVCSGA